MHPCPKCGHCPTCGRSNLSPYTYPYYQPAYPVGPTWVAPYPLWYGNSTGTWSVQTTTNTQTT